MLSEFRRTKAVLAFEGYAEMALIVVAKAGSDDLDGQRGVEQVLGGEHHAVIEEILEYRRTKLLTEGSLERALVGAYKNSEGVDRWHVRIARENYIAGIVHL